MFRRRKASFLALIFALGGVMLLSLSLGSVSISISTIAKLLLSKLPFIELNPSWEKVKETIILEIRLPRIILAGLVGAALAISGAGYQGLLRNPLADPYLLGVSAGALLGAVIGYLMPFSKNILGLGSIPLFAFAGGVVAVVLVYLLSRTGKTIPVSALILAGVAVGAFFAAITSYLLYLNQDKLPGMLSWLLGKFSIASWRQVVVVLPYVLIGALVIWLHFRPLNVLQLDEEQAQQLGINVERTKLTLMATATLMTSAAVSVSGLIGFVGIIIPHTVRLLWGPDYRFLLPCSFLLGGIFLILADTIARTALSPGEIPVGSVTAFFGAPFFLFILRQRKRLLWS